MEQMNTDMLEAAARKLYAGSSVVKYYVLHQINQAPGKKLTLEEAARAARVPLNILEPILAADAVFRLQNAAGSSGAGTRILRADEQQLLNKASQSGHAADRGYKSHISSVAHRLKLVTSPPVEFLDGLHPVRLGLPTCLYWVLHRTCMHNQSCVFNHPRLAPLPPGSGTKAARKAARAEKRAAVKKVKAELHCFLLFGSIAPPRRSRASNASAAVTGTGCRSTSSSSGTVQDPGTPSSGRTSSGSGSGSSTRPAASTAAAGKEPQHPAVAQWVSRSMRPCAIPILPPQNPRLLDPDDWMPAKKASSRTEQQDWAATAEAAEARAAAAAAWTEAFAAAAAAAAGTAWSGEGSREPGRSDSELSLSNAQLTQGAVTAPCATAASAAAAPTAASAAVAAAGAMDAADQPQVHVQETPGAASSTAAGLALQQAQQQATHKWPQSGVNDDGLPMYCGAPNCYQYMGTGRCPVQGSTCRYNHPNDVLLPAAFVEKGYIPCINYSTHQAPFACLAAQLQRLWDYTSCVEAQLKVWLAHYLLAAANPGCRLYSESAAHLAVKESHTTPASDSQPLGPYSCSVGEADAVLQTLWAAAPDDSSSSPMPYAGRLQELLAGDPYLQLHTSQALGAATVVVPAAAVMLRVHAIAEVLYF